MTEMDERLARKVSLAQERNSRVMLVRTNDTHRVLDIVRAADKGIKILRGNLIIRFTPEEVIPLLREYQKAIENLHLVTARICELAGVQYRPPRGLDLPPAVGSLEDAKDEKKVDELMEAAYQGDGKSPADKEDTKTTTAKKK